MATCVPTVALWLSASHFISSQCFVLRKILFWMRITWRWLGQGEAMVEQLGNLHLTLMCAYGEHSKAARTASEMFDSEHGIYWRFCCFRIPHTEQPAKLNAYEQTWTHTPAKRNVCVCLGNLFWNVFGAFGVVFVFVPKYLLILRSSLLHRQISLTTFVELN